MSEHTAEKDAPAGAVVAEEWGVHYSPETMDVTITAFKDVQWTPAKRAAWNDAVGAWLGRVQHPDDL